MAMVEILVPNQQPEHCLGAEIQGTGHLGLDWLILPKSQVKDWKQEIYPSIWSKDLIALRI